MKVTLVKRPTRAVFNVSSNIALFADTLNELRTIWKYSQEKTCDFTAFARANFDGIIQQYKNSKRTFNLENTNFIRFEFETENEEGYVSNEWKEYANAEKIESIVIALGNLIHGTIKDHSVKRYNGYIQYWNLDEMVERAKEENVLSYQDWALILYHIGWAMIRREELSELFE